MEASEIQEVALNRLHIVRQRDRKDVELTRVMRGAECWTDLCLLRAKLIVIVTKA